MRCQILEESDLVRSEASGSPRADRADFGYRQLVLGDQDATTVEPILRSKKVVIELGADQFPVVQDLLPGCDNSAPKWIALQPRVNRNEIFLVGLDSCRFNTYYPGSVRLLTCLVVDQEYDARSVDRLAE